jgi:hypothetical protein
MSGRGCAFGRRLTAGLLLFAAQSPVHASLADTKDKPIDAKALMSAIAKGSSSSRRSAAPIEDVVGVVFA